MTARWMPPSFADGPVDESLWNALVALSGEEVPAGRDGAYLTFSLCDAPHAGAWAAEMTVVDPARPFIAHVREFPFEPLFDVDLDVADLEDLPDGFRQALYEGMFASVRQQIEDRRLAGLALGRQGLVSSFAAYGSQQHQWFDVVLHRADGHVVAIQVCGERAAIVTLLADLPQSAAPLRTALAQRLVAAADVTLGSITVKLADRGALLPGSVVVMAERPPGLVMVRFQDRIFDFAREDAGWRCQGVRAFEADRVNIAADDSEGKMNDEEAPAITDIPVPIEAQDPVKGPALIEEPISIGDIRIALDFDLGRMQLPLSEISEWRPGSLVLLERADIRSGLAVTIRANDRVVGAGDVVLVDERIAVRITELYLKD